MSKSDEFRQFAEEAMRWARQSKTEEEQLAFMELARTWTQAALHRESTAAVNYSTAPHRKSDVPVS